MTWWDEMRWDDEMRWWDEMIRWYEMRWNMRWDEMRWWDDARHIDCVMSLHSCPFVYLSVCRSVAIYSFFLLIVIYHSRNSSSICQTVWGEKTWKTSDPLTYVGNWHAKSNQNTRLVCSFLYHKSSAREIRLKVEFAPIVALCNLRVAICSSSECPFLPPVSAPKCYLVWGNTLGGYSMPLLHILGLVFDTSLASRKCPKVLPRLR